MVRVTCIIKPHKLEAVKSAVASIGVNGLTVSDVRGSGNSVEESDWLGGDRSVVALPIRSKVMVVVADDQVEPVVQAMIENAHSGEAGDGKIFLEQVADAIRIRTREHGNPAI